MRLHHSTNLFGAALAEQHKAGLVTGDPEFKAVEKEIRIAWLSPFLRSSRTGRGLV